MPSPSLQVDLPFYAGDTAIIATSSKPNLFNSYLESYFSKLQRWLNKLRIAIKFSKSTAIIFARARRSFIQPHLVTIPGYHIKWVDTTRYLGVIPQTRLTWFPHIDHVRKRAVRRMSMLGLFLNRKSDLSVRNGDLRYKQFSRPMIYDVCPAWRSAARIHVRRLQVLQYMNI